MAQDRETNARLTQFLSIRSGADIATYLGTTEKRLDYLARAARYRSFEIPKRSGGTRVIEAPPKEIRIFQRQIAKALNTLYRPTSGAHGFVAGRSILTNAGPHVGQGLILNIDFKDFFHTFTLRRVIGLFMARPCSFPHTVAWWLARICCWNGRLPQGAPTSPVISNLICRRLDRDLVRLARAAGCRYTRYADDITFSRTHDSFPSSIAEVRQGRSFARVELGSTLVGVIGNHDLEIHGGKIRAFGRAHRQEVTGLIVNVRPNVTRSWLMQLRAMLHHWEKEGESAAEMRMQVRYGKTRMNGAKPCIRNHVKGKLDYLSMVRGKDDLVWAKYALQYGRLTNAQRGSILLSGDVALKAEFLKHAMWIVAKQHRGGWEENGTAFSVAGTGIVTCEHVVRNHGRSGRWKLIPAWDPLQSYDFRVQRSCSHRDLAVLEGEAPIVGALQANVDSEVRAEDQVLLAGFPNWLPGNQLTITRPRVSETRLVSQVKRFRVDREIFEGNSGGPMLNASGEVVGVVVYGRGGAIVPNSCVSIRHLKDFS